MIKIATGRLRLAVDPFWHETWFSNVFNRGLVGATNEDVNLKMFRSIKECASVIGAHPFRDDIHALLGDQCRPFL